MTAGFCTLHPFRAPGRCIIPSKHCRVIRCSGTSSLVVHMAHILSRYGTNAEAKDDTESGDTAMNLIMQDRTALETTLKEGLLLPPGRPSPSSAHRTRPLAAASAISNLRLSPNAAAGAQHPTWHNAVRAPAGGRVLSWYGGAPAPAAEGDSDPPAQASSKPGRRTWAVRCLQNGPPPSTDRREPSAEAAETRRRDDEPVPSSSSPAVSGSDATASVPGAAALPEQASPERNLATASEVGEEGPPRHAAADPSSAMRLSASSNAAIADDPSPPPPSSESFPIREAASAIAGDTFPLSAPSAGQTDPMGSQCTITANRHDAAADRARASSWGLNAKSAREGTISPSAANSSSSSSPSPFPPSPSPPSSSLGDRPFPRTAAINGSRTHN
mmetsp:Transcript_5262/g.15260  ORF Transcript_5262/g.15260 Transcript_5262/m.15260 type:complete len:387 (-) Transcript_5262:292-1452(-)